MQGWDGAPGRPGHAQPFRRAPPLQQAPPRCFRAGLVAQASRVATPLLPGYFRAAGPAAAIFLGWSSLGAAAVAEEGFPESSQESLSRPRGLAKSPGLTKRVPPAPTPTHPWAAEGRYWARVIKAKAW